MKRVLKAILLISILIYIGFGFVLYFNQDNYIYYPKYTKGILSKCAKDIGGIPIIEGDLKGVLIPKSTSSLIVMYHGNATNACERGLYSVGLHDNPSSILFVSYPGYLGDDTKVSNKNILSEVKSVISWAKNNNYRVDGIVGESIGVGPASYQSYLSPAPLALIAPYDKLSNVAKNMFWMYPTSLIIKDDYLVVDWIKNSPKLLLIAGSKDQIMSKKNLYDLYNSIPKEQKKELVVLENFDHVDLLIKSEVVSLVVQFLKELLVSRN